MSWSTGGAGAFPPPWGGRSRATSEEGEVDEEGEIRSPSPPPVATPSQPQQPLPPPLGGGGNNPPLLPPAPPPPPSLGTGPPPPSSMTLPPLPQQMQQRRSGHWGSNSNEPPSSNQGGGPAPPLHGEQPPLPPPPSQQQPPQPPMLRAASMGVVGSQQHHHHHQSHHPHMPQHHHHHHHHHHQHPASRFEHRHSLGGGVLPEVGGGGGGAGPGAGGGAKPAAPAFPPPHHVPRSQSFSGFSHHRGGGGGGGMGLGGATLPQQVQQQPPPPPHRPTDPRFRGAPPTSGEASRAVVASFGGPGSGPGGGGQPYPDPPPGSAPQVFSSYSMLAEANPPQSAAPPPPPEHVGSASPGGHPPQISPGRAPPAFYDGPPPRHLGAPNLHGGGPNQPPPPPPQVAFPPPEHAAGTSTANAYPPQAQQQAQGLAPQQQHMPPFAPAPIQPPPPHERGYEQHSSAQPPPLHHAAPQLPPHKQAPHPRDVPGIGGTKPFGIPGFRRGGRGGGPGGGAPTAPGQPEPPSYYGPSQHAGPPPPRHSPTRFFPPGREHRGGPGMGPAVGAGGFPPGETFRRGGPADVAGPDPAQLLPPPPLSDPAVARLPPGDPTRGERPAPPPFAHHHQREREPDRPIHLDSQVAAAALPSSSSPPPLLASRDPFGRTREWGGPSGARSSPHASPRGHRRPIVALSEAAGGGPPPSFPPQQQTPASVPLASEPPQPQALTTRALGDDAARGERAVRTLAQILPASSLPPHLRALTAAGAAEPPTPAAEPDALELPNKQLLYRALATVDGQLKAAQRQVDASASGQDEARSRYQQAQADLEQAEHLDERKRDEQRQRLAQARLRKQEEAQRLALEAKEQERLGEWERAEELELQGMESKMAELRRQEERQHQDETSKQVAVVNEHFDRELAETRYELEQELSQTQDLESEMVVVESHYKVKVSGGMQQFAPPNTQDVVASILASNQKRAAEAHMLALAQGLSPWTDTEQTSLVAVDDSGPSCSVEEALQNASDPKDGRTNAEWAQLAQQVTGLADALYSEPSDAPYFEANEKRHAEIAPFVKEYIRDKRNRLQQHWTELAEEYEFRRKAYSRLMKKRHKGRKQHRSSSVAVRHSILGIKPGVPILESSGSRASTNPYRRARRGNEVRSEYEQEQIIAEIAAKEAMEKKIHFGGSKLPRQVGRLERELTAKFVQTFTSHRVDLVAQERELAITNVWSDTEKCIFLDRFMQHPKDFRKIASFLKNKSTRDCVAFYYNSKQTVPYKAALKEHIMRRKRRGDYHTWDATIDAALSCGATVEVGTSEAKPLLFLLPEHDQTFATFALHPIKREMFDTMEVDEAAAKAYEEEDESVEPKKSGQKRKYEPLFTLEPEKRRFLPPDSPETVPPLRVSPSRTSLAETEVTETSAIDPKVDGAEANAPLRRAPQKWTNSEKKVFVDTLEKHGRNWSLLAEAVGTKSISQIKNFYYDYKKQSGKVRQEKDATKKPKSDLIARGRKRDEDSATPTPAIPESMPETPMESAGVAVSANEEESTPRTPRPFPESQAQLADSIRHQHKPQPHLPAMDELSSMHPSEEAAVRHPPLQQRSGAATPEGLSLAERWIQLQQQNLFSRHQHQQQQTTQQTVEEAARRLLQQQHHQHQAHHQHHQQILSNLMPWVGGSGGGGGGAGMHHDWAESSTAQQQLQALLQLRQRHEQQQQQLAQHQLQQQQHHHHHHHHHSNPFTSLGAAAQLRARGWEGLAGGGSGSGAVNAAALELALAHQQLQQQQSAVTTGSSSGSGPASRGHSRGASSSDLGQQQQLALAQQLLALHHPGGGGDASSAAADAALALLQRAMGGGNQPFPDGPGGGGGSSYGGSG